MGKPKPGNILEQLEASRREGNLFQGDRDFEGQDRWVREHAEKTGAKIHFFPSSTVRNPKTPPDGSSRGESAGVDPLYGDILDPEFFDNPELRDDVKKNLACLIEHHPSKQLLKKYGIDEEREVIFHIPFTLLREKGLVTPRAFRGVDLGDLVLWDGTWYMVYNAHRGSYQGQRINHFYTAAICNRYRLNNVPTEDNRGSCTPEEEAE
jgi:hypothetical protein